MRSYDPGSGAVRWAPRMYDRAGLRLGAATVIAYWRSTSRSSAPSTNRSPIAPSMRAG
jgi:hypothetical protein